MSRGTKPLLSGRLKARAQKELLLQKQEDAQRTYPFEQISPRLKVKISPRAKRMALRLDPKTRHINLVVPKRSSIQSAFLFAEENADWIEEKLAELPQPIKFTDGTTLPLLGRPRMIVVEYNPKAKTTNITLNRHEILVSTNKKDPSSRIKRYLVDLAKTSLSTMAHEKAEQIGKTISSLEVKDTISRWGSCSCDGKISLSWRLIFAPKEAYDYVVAHEVAHLVHLDHSQHFWDVCEDLSWKYEYGHRWIKENGNELMRYTD